MSLVKDEDLKLLGLTSDMIADLMIMINPEIASYGNLIPKKAKDEIAASGAPIIVAVLRGLQKDIVNTIENNISSIDQLFNEFKDSIAGEMIFTMVPKDDIPDDDDEIQELLSEMKRQLAPMFDQIAMPILGAYFPKMLADDKRDNLQPTDVVAIKKKLAELARNPQTLLNTIVDAQPKGPEMVEATDLDMAYIQALAKEAPPEEAREQMRVMVGFLKSQILHALKAEQLLVLIEDIKSYSEEVNSATVSKSTVENVFKSLPGADKGAVDNEMATHFQGLVEYVIEPLFDSEDFRNNIDGTDTSKSLQNIIEEAMTDTNARMIEHMEAVIENEKNKVADEDLKFEFRFEDGSLISEVLIKHFIGEEKFDEGKSLFEKHIKEKEFDQAREVIGGGSEQLALVLTPVKNLLTADSVLTFIENLRADYKTEDRTADNFSDAAMSILADKVGDDRKEFKANELNKMLLEIFEPVLKSIFEALDNDIITKDEDLQPADIEAIKKVAKEKIDNADGLAGHLLYGEQAMKKREADKAKDSADGKITLEPIVLPKFRPVGDGKNKKDFESHLKDFFGVIDKRILAEKPDSKFCKTLVTARTELQKIITDSDATTRAKPADNDKAELEVMKKLVKELTEKVKVYEKNAKGLDARQFFMSILGVLAAIGTFFILPAAMGKERYVSLMFSNSKQRTLECARFELEDGLKAQNVVTAAKS